MRGKMQDLAHIYFGMAAAENEVAEDRARFLRTYYDRWDLLPDFEQHRKFLLLGPKGAGKSAAARFIDLKWQDQLGQEKVFSTFVDFDELNRTQSPLTSLDRKLVGDVPALTDAAWRLFLGVRLLDSLISDPMCQLSRDPLVLKLVDDLRKAGMASDDYPQVLRRVRERRGVIGVPKWLSAELKSAETEALSAEQLGDAIIRLVVQSSSPNRHLLVIDGLDKAIGDNVAYWQTLAALVRVGDALRRLMQAERVDHVYAIILCRSDVFRRVRFADAAKIAADGGIHIDWGAEAENPRDVLLWDYLGHKAQMDRNAIFALLPPAINVGRRGRVSTDRYILQFTRYTPRDMTLMFNALKEEWQGSGIPSGAVVRRAADHFASRHLLTEMMAEASGLLPNRVIDRFEQIMSSLPRRVFDQEALERALAEAGVADDVSVGDFGEYLFLQGAIGNYRNTAGYVQFYHRRDAYKFQRRGPWVLHTGLVYAFNVPWT
jgi:hypothetical protein